MNKVQQYVMKVEELPKCWLPESEQTPELTRADIANHLIDEIMNNEEIDEYEYESTE